MWPKKIFRKFQIDFFFYENVFLFPIFFWPTEWKKLILWSWRILEQFIQIVKVQRNSFWKKNGIQTPTGKVRKLFIFTRGLPGAISSFLVLLIHTASRINCNLFEKKENYSKTDWIIKKNKELLSKFLKLSNMISNGPNNLINNNFERKIRHKGDFKIWYAPFHGFSKVHIFWEGYKILGNLHQLFVLLTYFQSKNWWRFRKILWPSQNIWTLLKPYLT